MSFAGTWNTKTQSPMGNQEGVLTLEQNGDDLSGNIASAAGKMDIEDGKIDGDKATWVVNMTSPMPIKLEFEASVDGDAISGNIKLGAFGSATMSGTRA